MSLERLKEKLISLSEETKSLYNKKDVIGDASKVAIIVPGGSVKSVKIEEQS